MRSYGVRMPGSAAAQVAAAPAALSAPSKSVKVPTAPRSILGSVAQKWIRTSFPSDFTTFCTFAGCSCGCKMDTGGHLGLAAETQQLPWRRQAAQPHSRPVGMPTERNFAAITSLSTLRALDTIRACSGVANVTRDEYSYGCGQSASDESAAGIYVISCVHSQPIFAFRQSPGLWATRDSPSPPPSPPLSPLPPPPPSQRAAPCLCTHPIRLGARGAERGKRQEYAGEAEVNPGPRFGWMDGSLECHTHKECTACGCSAVFA